MCFLYVKLRSFMSIRLNLLSDLEDFLKTKLNETSIFNKLLSKIGRCLFQFGKKNIKKSVLRLIPGSFYFVNYQLNHLQSQNYMCMRCGSAYSATGGVVIYQERQLWLLCIIYYSRGVRTYVPTLQHPPRLFRLEKPKSGTNKHRTEEGGHVVVCKWRQ